MARGSNEVTVTFAGDSSDLERAFNRVGLATRGFDNDIDRVGSNVRTRAGHMGAALAGFGAIAAAGLATAGVAAVSFGLDMVRAAEESAKVTRQTEAVITSMGAAAWTSAKDVAELSEALSNKTGIDDELIQSGENVLLTFGNIRNEVGKGNDIFDRATTAALDMSVALGQDLQSSVTQVGKALNDPIEGISALSRVGIQFTEDQKAMIAQLVATGDTLGAQQIILAELERQFGGSAEAQATATERLQTAWGNLQESIGEKLLPTFQSVTDWLINTGIPWFESFATEIKDDVGPAVQNLAAWTRDDLLPALQELWAWLQENIIPVYQDMAATLRDDLLPALSQLWADIREIFGATQSAKDETAGLSDAFKVLGFVAFGTAGGLRVMLEAFTGIVQIVRSAVGAVKDLVNWLRQVKIPGTGGGLSLGNIFGGGLTTFLFSGGGLVPQYAATGMLARGTDTVPAMLTPGEMVLNRGQQGELFRLLSEGNASFGSGRVEAGLASVVAAVREVDSSILFVGNTINRTIVHATNLLSGLGRNAENWANPINSRTKALWEAVSNPAPAAAPAPAVNVYVQGSIRSDRDLVQVIRDEFDRGGFRGVA